MTAKLPIPADALSQHIIVLGKTRSGKSSKVRVLVEWLLEHKKRVVILTPKDDWWGLKASADGKSDGYPIVIFGGKHEDLPFNPRAGAQVAELISTGNRPCLITFARQKPSDRTRFYNDFMEGLFKFHQGELYVVIDEVHNFAPKGKVFSPDAGMMIHWSNTLASEGQGQGLIMIAAS
jgi:DNA helicase HerA-like ATPase